MLELIRELGWEDKVIFPRPLTVMYHKGKFYPFDSILRALLFPGLGFGLDKIRFGFVGLFLRLTNNWKALEKFTADEWMMKWAGKNVYEKMWKPLLVGKFGPFYQDVNMAWMWARIKARTTRLGTFEGGFQRFADLFAEKLRGMGVEIRLGAKVESVKREEAQLSVRADGESASFDKVLVTTSPNLMAKLSPDLAGKLFEGLARAEVYGRGGDGAVAQTPVVGRRLLLVQPAEGGRLPDAGIGGAYEFCLEGTFRRGSYRVCGRLSGSGTRVFFDER